MHPIKNLFTRQVLFFSLITVFFFACVSAQKRAKEQLDKGNYAEAVQLYEYVLKRNPNDPEATSGLKAARAGYLDKKLIDVRMARQSGNFVAAGETLLEVIQKQKDWGIAAGSKSSLTQAEESEEFFKATRKVVNDEVAAGRPLKASQFVVKFEKVLNTLNPKMVGQMNAKISDAGKKDCEARQKKIPKESNFFTREFLAQYCAFFGASFSGGKGSAPKSGDGAITLFGDVMVENAVEGLTGTRKLLFEQALIDGFKSTAWFYPSTQEALGIRIKGAFTEKHNKTVIVSRHNYTIQEPYTAYEDVKKSRTYPVTTSKQVNGRWQEVTEYKTQEYYEKVPVTRHRDIQQVYTYSATEHDQNLALDLWAGWNLKGSSAQVAFANNAKGSGIEHKENQPNIGLKPAVPQLVDVDAWLKTNAADWKAKVADALSLRWVELYCKPSSDGNDPASVQEDVHRCTRQRPTGSVTSYSSFAESWFQNQMGMSVAETLAVLVAKK
ncbi:MAG: tetratricopeptide repeat protein [Bdellovibrionales bacterium]|nr:tetratricopeptide repeat protein [Bdellovibrionales bacterium]